MKTLCKNLTPAQTSYSIGWNAAKNHIRKQSCEFFDKLIDTLEDNDKSLINKLKKDYLEFLDFQI